MKKSKRKEEDYGSSLKFDPDFNGPLNKRSCTDVLCLLIFVAFLACWGVVAYFAFRHGDPARLLTPTDSEGRRCGIDEEVKDKEYLLFFNLAKCADPSVIVTGCNTPQVCVTACPTSSFYVGEYLLVGSPADLRRRLICKPTFDVSSVSNYNDARAAVDREDCAEYYFPSVNIHGRCVPLANKQAGTLIMASLSEVGFLVDALIRRVTTNTRAREVGQMIVEDLAKSWPWIVGLLVIAMITSLIFIILMRWFAGLMVWISLIGVHVALGYSIYACWAQWDYLKKNPAKPPTPSLNLEQQSKALLAMEETWLAFLIISCILLIIVFLLTIFLRSRIRVAIALIGEASKAVGSVTSTLAFPLVPWVLQCAVIVWAVVLMLYLAGSGKEVFKVTGMEANTTCSCEGVTYQNGWPCTSYSNFSSCGASCPGGRCQFFQFKTEPYVIWLHVVNVFGFFWALFFVSAIGEMILAGTFATWYWTYHKSDVPFFTLTAAAARTFRYNLGTLAFGSLIIAICRMIRVALEFVNNQLKKYDNCCVKVVMCCCRCFFWCLESFIKFINRNAYIMCAVHGKNFCASAKDAFELLMRNIIRVVVLDKVTDFLLLLGKLLITTGVCSLGFFLFDHRLEVDVEELKVPTLNYSLMPVFIVAIGSFFIATLFFNVYAMAVDTLFLCFLEDSERNDGSVEKPYFMSKDLRKLLGKKNK